MQSIHDGLQSTTSILRIAGKLPVVGPAIRVLKVVIDRTKPGIKRGLDRIKVIDRKLQPLKKRIDNGVEKCDKGRCRQIEIVVFVFGDEKVCSLWIICRFQQSKH